jgi:uncharacterized phage protein (TIGR01671 family)
MTQRPIKFRAWDKEERQMYELPPFVALLDTIDGRQIKAQMQFTGLHDKNGKEIWEGDVVCATWKEGDVIQDTFEVTWGEEGGYFLRWEMGEHYIPALGTEGYTLEVIGNVWENPELLDTKARREKMN